MATLHIDVNIPPFAEDMRKRAREVLRVAGPKIAEVLRTGRGSVAEQFQRSQGYSGRRTISWPRTKPFGSRKPPTKTLVRTGSYRAAWLGRSAGSITRVSRDRVQIGVDSTRFPQVRVFQANRPTRIRVTRKMRFFLGLNYGVWLRASTTHLTNHPRPLGIGGHMLDRSRRVILNYISFGEATEQTRRGLAA